MLFNKGLPHSKPPHQLTFAELLRSCDRKNPVLANQLRELAKINIARGTDLSRLFDNFPPEVIDSSLVAKLRSKLEAIHVGGEMSAQQRTDLRKWMDEILDVVCKHLLDGRGNLRFFIVDFLRLQAYVNVFDPLRIKEVLASYREYMARIVSQPILDADKDFNLIYSKLFQSPEYDKKFNARLMNILAEQGNFVLWYDTHKSESPESMLQILNKHVMHDLEHIYIKNVPKLLRTQKEEDIVKGLEMKGDVMQTLLFAHDECVKQGFEDGYLARLLKNKFIGMVVYYQEMMPEINTALETRAQRKFR